MPATFFCHCCYRKLATQYYAPKSKICQPCLALDVSTAINLTRANLIAEYTARASVKQGHRDARRERLLERIATYGKRCTSCHHSKPASAYAACAPRLDGLQTECKACMKLRTALMANGPRSTWHTIRDALRAQAPKNKQYKAV